MQTFLPYESFSDSLRALDNRRLGKQRVEAKQIYDILTGTAKGPGWRNHPAVKMWRGFERALALYYNLSLLVWKMRGFQSVKLQVIESDGEPILPPFIGQDSFHASHRSNLLRKDPVFYGKYGWTEPPVLPYQWGAV